MTSSDAQTPIASPAGKDEPLGISGDLYPLPVHKDQRLIWPGVNRESQEAVTRLVKENNANFHCFFNERGFHNHLTHHLYAIYALGAAPNLLQDAYDLHAGDQRPAFKSPEEITEKNWKDHLGDEKYYVTSKLANTSSSAGSQGDKEVNPWMLDRFVGGLLHPLIHAGHGAEFNVDGMLVEGLALMAVTKSSSKELYPLEFFEFDTPKLDTVAATSSSFVPRLASLTLGSGLSSSATASPSESSPSATQNHVSALNILKEISSDPSLAAGQACDKDSDSKFNDTLRKKGVYIREKYTSRFTVGQGEEGIEKALEEVIWTAVMVYGLGGYRQGKDFRSHFLLLHCVTSVFFLPFFVDHLKHDHHAQSVLIRAHFSITLALYISQGRPQLPVESFFKPSLPEEIHQLVPKYLLSVSPNEKALGQKLRVAEGDHRITPIGNPFPAVILSSLHHPQEHLIKVNRALADFDERYGTRSKGYWKVEGWEELDGTLFRRVALRTMKALGWMREGEAAGNFEFDGLGWGRCVNYAFPADILDGPMVDEQTGLIVYLIATKRTFGGGGSTSVTRPDGSSVGDIRWHDLCNITLIAFNGLAPMTEDQFMVEKRSNGLFSPYIQIWRDESGEEFYWKGGSCYDDQGNLIARYDTSVPHLFRKNEPATLHIDSAYAHLLDRMLFTTLMIEWSGSGIKRGSARGGGEGGGMSGGDGGGGDD
ncbi:hypothetical protein FRB97_000245 [Tulasnella sp. 331]|nr:hypothetical protein FRB97_000245 [Tulasnella sp. 331]